MSGHILVATGTKREAATLTRPGFVVIPGGGDAAGLRAKLLAAADGARGVMSFGFAGALAEGLKIGDWVVGDRLVGASEVACNPGWTAALLAQLPAARLGTIYADGRLIGTSVEKLALGARHAALAVDMESHIAAQVAAERGLPFAIVRCVSDEARRSLPPAIAVAMRADGGVDGLAMLHSLVMQPGQVFDFVRTSVTLATAMRKLAQGRVMVGSLPMLPACPN